MTQKRWTEVLCQQCGGNGVIKIHHGVSECPRCEGRCYEPEGAPPWGKPEYPNDVAPPLHVQLAESRAETETLRATVRRLEQENSMKPATERYQTDAMFRQLVDTLYAAIDRADFSPTEIREAAMLAHILYEERRIKPMMITDAEMLRDFNRER